MVKDSSSLANRASTYCPFCRQPLGVVNGRIEAWRSSTGRYFCSEFCAEGEEEGRFEKLKRAS